MTSARRCLIYFVLFLTGCAALTLGSQFQSGRQALLRNDPETALVYFHEVADKNPTYIYRSMDFRENIWTYLGRAQYETKRYDQARKSLERALSLDRDDNLARLYLGLTLARSGELARGTKEIESAMQGIYDWLEYMNRTRPLEAYWDPLRQMRNSIEKDLQAISGREGNTEELLANAEWLGKEMEQEIDRVRRDERRQFDRDRDRERGVSIGVGLGF
jgi:tetratricopeptide (TPR) repeat protein